MPDLSIDVETYSDLDLGEVGVYKYCSHPSFELLWIGYSLDGGDVITIDMADPNYAHLEEFSLALADRAVVKRAWNASFERCALGAHYGRPMDPREWRCTMVHAATCGLPLSLDACAKVLGTQEKDAQGKTLINLFTKPQKPTRNQPKTRIRAEDQPMKWAAFGAYCAMDVMAEMAVEKKISHHKILRQEQRLWELDQRINDRGIEVDLALATNAIEMDRIFKSRVMAEARELTGLDNPASPPQMMAWLKTQGVQLRQLTKDIVKALLKDELDPAVRRALELRQLLAKTSVSKYEAILAAAGDDSRLRGAHQFYGANRTGRWAGRLLQVQNLPQNHIEALDTARGIVRDGDLPTLELLFDSVPDTLSQLIRTAIVAPEGKILSSVDFSAIEARVIAWLAGEKWRLEVFNTHGRIYEASAAAMFKVPIEEVDKKMRAKGKIAELALGYQGSVGALLQMGAISMGLEEEELPGLVSAWRKANRRICLLWEEIEDAAIEAVLVGHSRFGRHLTFHYSRGSLFIILPSGRRLSYYGAKIDRSQGRPQVMYMGMNQTTKKWERDRTYGGKLVENIVQAIARDLLADKMQMLDAAGMRIVMHVHDEIVIEGDGNPTLAAALEVMGMSVAWAPGLPLTADGFNSQYFKK